jgi:predicted DNA-binding transcriptional regulator AlpA
MFKTSEPNPGSNQPLLIDAKAVGVMLGRCERTIWRDDAAVRIPRAVVIGGSKRWSLKDLRRWVAAGCPARNVWESQRPGRAVDRRETHNSNGGA